MNRYRLFSLTTATLLLSVIPLHAQAPAANAETCLQRVVDELANVRDEYRSYVYGSREQREGGFAVLGGGEAEEAREGIFESKERLTSDLVLPLVMSYRTLRCKAVAVCQVASVSSRVNDVTVKAHPLGCEEQEIPVYPECNFSPSPEAVSDGKSATQADAAQIANECGAIVEETLRVERANLKLGVGYDTGYRALLQFAGMMDWMLEDLSTKAVKPVRDMVNMLGKLYQIPCFISQCDNPDTSDIVP